VRLVFSNVRLVDGVGDTARAGVDVVVDGERIHGVVAHGSP